MATFLQTLSGPNGGIDLDLDEVWSRALEEYEHTTGISLKQNLRGFNAVAADVDERLNQSKVSNKAKAQQIMGNAMVCLERFGSIIAQATSVVFGPSQHCWNAISFVIAAAQGYQAVLDGFAALMERCVVFFERLNVDLDAKLQSGVPFDARLRKSTYKIVSHFFTALGHSRKLAASKRQKIKTVFKIVLFNDDAGVKDSLARMETLVRDLTDTKVSVILQDVQGLARYVRDSEEEINRHQEEIKAGIARIELGVQRTEVAVTQMHLDLNQKFSEDAAEKNLSRISKALRLGDHHSWQERHQDYSSRRVASTGQWLLRPGNLVTAWADVKRNGVKVMTLTGPPAHGKSYLSSFVIDHLLGEYPRVTTGNERACVAYYYTHDSDDDSLTKCLSSLVFQFAKTNPTYAQAVAIACSRPEGFSSAEELWKQLVANLRHLLHGTYFIVIDGLAGVAEDDVRKNSVLASIVNMAQSPNDRWGLRLFVSAQDGNLLVPAFERPGVARIMLGANASKARPGIGRSKSGLDGDNETSNAHRQALHNEEDFKLFTRARIAAMCLRKPYLSSTLSDPTVDAASALARGVQGDYSTLQVKLDQIEASDSTEDVLAVIRRASEDPKELLRKDIELLNETLSPEEIQELNDLLIWVTGSFETTTLSFLEAAIGNKSLWLKKHIPQKYYRLLRWDESTDIVEAPHSAELVKALRETAVTLHHSGKGKDNSQTSTSVLQEGEIELVERVVKTFCGEQLFDKFNFSAFFQSKLGKRNARIQLPDEMTMHAQVLHRCLSSFSLDIADEYFAPLRRYAAAHFVGHLRCLDLDRADREELKATGAILADLVSNERSIRTWWQAPNANFLQLEDLWVLKEDNVKLLKDYLRHPLLTAGFKDDPIRLPALEPLLDDTAGPHSVLESVAKILTKDWYESIHGNEYHFWWAIGIMFKAWKRSWSDSTVPDVRGLEDFDTWAKQLPDIRVSAAQWNSRIATVLSFCGHDDEALAKCLEVDRNASDPWPALLKAAEINRKLKKHKGALEDIQQIRSKYYHLLQGNADFKKAYWLTVLGEEGLNHWALEDFDSAERCFLEIVNNKTDGDAIAGHADAMGNLFELWGERKTYDPAIERVKEWMAAADPADAALHWFHLLNDHTSFHECLVAAAAKHGSASKIPEAYEHVMGLTDPRKHAKEMRELRTSFAAVTYHSSISPKHKAIAFQYWHKVISTSDDDSDSLGPAPRALKYLTPRLLDEATSSGLSPMTPAANEHMEMLEHVAMSDLSVVRDAYRRNNDPRLVLIRLRHLSGQHAKAKQLATECLRAIFDQWPTASDENALLGRYCRLGQVFNVLDDDVNAVAAWRLLQPHRPESLAAAAETDGNDYDYPLDDEVVGSSIASVDVEPIVGAHHATQDARGSDSDGTKTDADPLSGLTAHIAHHCDGCRTPFKAMADVYICKDCLNVQLCPSCFALRMFGELHVLCCNKEHDNFLALPPFNRKRWERMDPKMMLVGGALMSRSAWLDGLRERWGLGQDRIDEHRLELAAQVQAAKVLTRWRKAVLRVRAVSK